MNNEKKMTSPNKKAPASPRKIIDVKTPGKSAPPMSGRPIIVTNRPVLKDPMMAGGEDSSSDKESEKIDAKASKPVKIMPLSHSEHEDKAEPLSVPGVPNLPEGDAEKLEKAARPEVIKISEEIDNKPEPKPAENTPEPVITAPEPAKPEELSVKSDDKTTELPDNKAADIKESNPVSDESDTEADKAKDLASATQPEPPGGEGEAENSADDQVSPGKAVDVAKKKEEDKKLAEQAEQEKIIDSKKYFLPINAVEHRRGLRQAIIALVLVIILALVWLDVVMDAGIIRLGSIHPFTHFFNS